MKIQSLNCASFCPLALKNFQKKYLDFFNQSNVQAAVRKLSNINKLTQVSSQLEERTEQINKFIYKKTGINLNLEFNYAQELSELVTHCLLIEIRDKLILVDTGIGVKQIQNKLNNTHYLNQLLLQPKNSLSETASYQMKLLGFHPKDVSDIIVTHLDYDHIGGLTDFPEAKLHLSHTEFRSANEQKNYLHRKRFIHDLWINHKKIEIYTDFDEKLYKIPMVRIRDIQEDIFLTSLPGHTKGHCGVYIPSFNLLFAGDSYIHPIQVDKFHTPLAIIGYKNSTTIDMRKYNTTLHHLQEIKKEGIEVFCSHNCQEFEHLKLIFNSNNIS